MKNVMREIKFRAWIHKDCGGNIPIECYETMDYSSNFQDDLLVFEERETAIPVSTQMKIEKAISKALN